MEKNKIYILEIECCLKGEYQFNTLPIGFKTLDDAKNYLVNVFVPNEIETSWIKDYCTEDLEQSFSQNNTSWECQYNDYELYTAVGITPILIQ